MGIVKTYRIWVIPGIFLFFALMSPPVAKLTPQILKSAMPAGMTPKIPEPTIVDAFAQYIKNLAQLGFLAAVLLSMGLMAEEKARGTLQLVVTKAVSRLAVLLSKFVTQNALIAASMAVAGALCYVFSIAVFQDGHLIEFAQANVLFIVYYVLIVTVTLFFSTLFNNQIAAGGASIVALAVLAVLPSLSRVLDRYSPGALPGLAGKLVAGQAEIGAAGWPLLTAVVLIVLLLGGAILIFNRQEL